MCHNAHQNTHWKLQETLLKPFSLVVLVDQATHSRPFIPSAWGILGVSPWHHYYIMPLPVEAPPTSNELSSQQFSHLDTPMHTCAWVTKHPTNPSFFIQFLMRQHLTCVGYSILWNTLCINIFHLRTHGKCDNILHITCFASLHAYSHNNQIINFSDDSLVIQRHALAGAQGEESLWRVNAVEHARLTYGGYLLCRETDHL